MKYSAEKLDNTLSELVIAYEHKVRSMPSPHASLRELYAAADNLKQNINECHDETSCQSLQSYQVKLDSLLSSWLDNLRAGVDNVSCNTVNFDDFEESVRPFLESLWKSVDKLSGNSHQEKENSKTNATDISVTPTDETKHV